MKFLSFFTLFHTTIVLGAVLDLIPREPKCPKREGNRDSQVFAYFQKTGQCFIYIDGGDPAKSAGPCMGPDGYCQKVLKSTSGTEGPKCNGFWPGDSDVPSDLISTDEDCNKYYPGKCLCECELCDEFVKIIIDGLEHLEPVVCAVMVSSFKMLIDVGIMFIPGGPTKGIKAAVQGAKSFYKNGEKAASFFGNWIGPACGVDDFDFDTNMIFESLVHAPDSLSLGPPVDCVKDSGCVDLEPVPDPE